MSSLVTAKPARSELVGLGERQIQDYAQQFYRSDVDSSGKYVATKPDRTVFCMELLHA